MSLCDPYKDLELYLEQVGDEITGLFEGISEDKGAVKNGRSDECNNKRFAQESFHKRAQSTFDSEGDADYLNNLDVIASDLAELLEQSKLNRCDDGRREEEKKKKTKGDESIVMNTATQTSPTVSHSSSLTDCCSSSPCLTDESSSSTEWTVGGWPPSVAVAAVDLGNKSSSAPVLKKASSKVNKQSRSQSDRHLAEIEATEACKWLRAAGFPQYAQLYEDFKFPMDVTSVQQDHPLLDADTLPSLYRRLWILNQCAKVHQLRSTQTDDSEDETCALSGNWTYLAESGRWSRVGGGGQQTLPFPTDDCTGGGVASKAWWTASLPHSKAGELPERTVKRANTLRDSGPHVLDILSMQVKIATPMHANDVQPIRRRRKLYSRSLDKNDEWSPRHSVDRLGWRKITSDQLSTESEEAAQEESKEIELYSCGQLQVVRKLALLKVTSFMERHCPSHRTGWNWELPKFIRKMKTPAYKDKQVFGVPLATILQRTGQTLPKSIQQGLQWLKTQADEQIGLFRKPGVKSRIQALRVIVESQNACINWHEHQPYDVADLMKQYFRELPEPLLTNKLSETLILVFQLEVSALLRRQALLCILLLLPDEHREALHVLLDFLHHVADRSDANQMNATNLALCFAPSLFQINQSASLTGGGGKQQQNIGSPGPRELAENKAAQECLAYMINHSNEIFYVPNELLAQCRFSDMEESIALPFSKLGEEQKQDWRGYQKACQNALLKEAREKGRGWVSIGCCQPRIELAYKKVADGHPLRLWRASAEIEAPPAEVMNRILRERHLWDEELHHSRIVAQLDGNAEIFQYVRNSMEPLLCRDYCVLRTWCSNLTKGACSIVETSVEHPDAPARPNSVRGIVLASRYLIEPCGSGRSRLLHLARVETKGKMLEWYHKCYGHICALFVSRIQASFKHSASGPESNV